MNRLVAGTITALLITAIGPPAFADPVGSTDSTWGPEMQAAVNDSFVGVWTQTDEDLIMSDQEVAAATPDPRPGGSTWNIDEPVVTAQVQGHMGGVTGETEASQTCWSWTTWVTQRSWLGSVRYQWHHRIGWCRIWNVRITSMNGHSDWTDHLDGMVEIKELSNHDVQGVGTMQAYNVLQRHLNMTFPIKGSIGSCYPQNYMHVGAVGRYWVTGQASC